MSNAVTSSFGNLENVTFLVKSIHDVSQRAKQAADPAVRDLFFSLKSELLSYAICRYSKSNIVKTQYHAHRDGPLVYVEFNLGDRTQGAHVPFNQLSGCSQYQTTRMLGNPYVFNRNHLSKPTYKTYKS